MTWRERGGERAQLLLPQLVGSEDQRVDRLVRRGEGLSASLALWVARISIQQALG